MLLLLLAEMCLVFKMIPALLGAYQNLVRHYQKHSIKETQTIGRQLKEKQKKNWLAYTQHL
jgi:hypothetical protein